MVVKFANKNATNKPMSSKTKLKESTKPIYVNDFLGKETFRLFNYAKTLNTIRCYAVYTTGTTVFLKEIKYQNQGLLKTIK